MKSSQLRPGMIVKASYNSTNQGEDLVEFLGFTGHTFPHGQKPDGSCAPIKFSTTAEMFKHYGVKTALELERLQENKFGYGCHSYMVLRDIETGETGAWYYLCAGKWCRGSGAEPLSFKQIEDNRSDSLKALDTKLSIPFKG